MEFDCMTKQSKINFTDLTWEDLQEWAGERIVRRGKSYRGNVKDLRITSDGVLASVQGTELYSTQVGLNAKGELFSKCTCPYTWKACKHAVAVILSYLEAFKDKQNIAPVDPEDDRLAELADELNDENDYDEGHEENDGNDDADQKDNPVRTHLEGLSKTELVDLMMTGKNMVPGLRRKLADHHVLQKGDITKLVSSIKKEIKQISREPAWANHWNGDGKIPDYTPVKIRLQDLLSNGHADAVVEIGSYLMDCGMAQVDQSSDEGETGIAISVCMDVVFEALMQSSLTAAQRILWDMDIHLKDNYGIIDDNKGPVALNQCLPADWGQVADVLNERLNTMPKLPVGEKNDFSLKYRRERVMKYLLHALEKASRQSEILVVLEREVAQTDCYVDLVNKFLQSGQKEKAKEWAVKGYFATLKHAPGLASRIEELLRELAIKEEDFPLAAAYLAFEFFYQPNLNKYSELKLSATKAGLWDEIRPFVMTYLETGEQPVKANAPAKKTLWPLPVLPIAREKNSNWIRFPDTSTLIDIAIDEGRHDDVLLWYRTGNKQNGFIRSSDGDKVAQAVSEIFPGEAMTIWKSLVAHEISQAKPSAYQTAGGYLKKINKVYEQTKESSAWKSYLASLRDENRRRPRMLDVLDKLEGNRTRIVG
jgi:uncharacterized Zn finger protein